MKAMPIYTTTKPLYYYIYVWVPLHEGHADIHYY